MLCLAACTPTAPTPSTEPVPPAPSAAPFVSTTVDPPAVLATASPAVSAAPAATVVASASAAPKEPAPPPIVCQDDDGCWLEQGPDGRDRPIARPKKLRGKKLRPCKDAEHTPACRDGVCVVRAWKC